MNGFWHFSALPKHAAGCLVSSIQGHLPEPDLRPGNGRFLSESGRSSEKARTAEPDPQQTLSLHQIRRESRAIFPRGRSV